MPHYKHQQQQKKLRLTQINLAGFKSFVDPTRIPVPGQLVGVVGPNGCGKSNVIDAVRWVLGETSARHLRGETMQDVLFNGSGDRKPVNRASVELIFDNSLGKAAGQWSQYAEISIKRVLQRDGDLQLEGQIITFTLTPNAVQRDGNIDQATLNRLTMGIQIRFTNAKDPEKDFDQQFTITEEFPPTVDITSIPPAAIDRMTDRLVADVFNKTVADW